jgi:hypothetical protein
VLVLLSCSNNGGSPDASLPSPVPPGWKWDDPPPPLDQRVPTPLDIALAKCKWPCDMPGCVKPLNGDECLVPCNADSDCPQGSICVCESDKCSIGAGNIHGYRSVEGVPSCFPLMPGLADALAECRRKGTCTKDPDKLHAPGASRPPRQP